MVGTNLAKLIKYFGNFLIFIGIFLNQFVLAKLSLIYYISPSKSLILIAYNISAIILGILLFVKAKTAAAIISKRKLELSILAGSILFVFILLEVFLRICMFTPYCNIASFNYASYYSNIDHTDYWYFKDYIFSNEWKEGAINIEEQTNSTVYREVSMEPDALLGFKRKKNVGIPCHETSNFGTRSVKNYTSTGKKILFYGNSFTATASCSNNTITSKIEKKTNIDTLNYGVGGYSMDQTYLLFKTTYSQFNSSENIILIGLLESDIDRMMLKARMTPKPYYTVKNNNLQLHTEHIDEENIMSYFDAYKPRPKIYVLNLILGKLGIRDVWNSYLDNKNKEKKKEITRLLLDEIAEIKEKDGLNIYMVLFYYFDPINPIDPGGWRRQFLISEFQKRNIDYIDLKECLTEYNKRENIPFKAMSRSGHFTSQTNDVLAGCIVSGISS